MTGGPRFDPRPGDTAYAPDGNRHARVLARRGDVVDLDIGYRPRPERTPRADAGHTRIRDTTSRVVEEGVPLELWATQYHEHTRRDPATTPRAGDVFVDTGENNPYEAPVYVVEGCDTSAVWVRGPDGTREAVPGAGWAEWLSARWPLTSYAAQACQRCQGGR